MFYYFLLARNAVLTRSQTHTEVIQRWPITSAWITRVSSILFFFDDKFSVKGRKSRSCGRARGYENEGERGKHWGTRRERDSGRAKRRSVYASRAEVRKTTTGLFFLHPVWITVIPPSIVYCGGELFYYRSVGRAQMLSEGIYGKETRTGERCGRETEYAKNDLCSARDSTIYRSCERKPQAHLERPMIVYPKESISLVNSLMIHLGSFSVDSAVEMAEDK